MPAYHQGPEIEVLLRSGLVCRFYDAGPILQPDAEELEALLGPRVRALYLVHHLGFPQDAARWLAWCRQRGLLLIEDATQGWLGAVADRPLGSFGDLAVFCLAATIAVPDGGLLRGNGSAAGPARGRGADAFRLRFLLPRLLEPDPAMIRRRNYRLLSDELAGHVPHAFASIPDGASPFVFPVKTDDVVGLVARLRRQGIEPLDLQVALHPSLPVPAFPGAARLRTGMVGLPVHQELRIQDVERIVAAVGAGSRKGSGFELETTTIEQLQPEWPRLAEQSRSIFKTWEWLLTWWEHFGRDRQPLVTAVRSNGGLVGILPLYLWKSWPLRVIRFLGHGPGDELGPICAAADRPVVDRALRRVLAWLDWDLVLAEQLPADQDWSALLGGRLLVREGNPILQFGRDGWEGFLRGRSANFREQVARRARKLAREHAVRYRLANGSGDLQGDLDTLFRLHAARWERTGSAFLAHEGFHRAFAAVALQRDWLRLWFLEIEGRAVAALYGFRFAGVESYYQAGRDPDWDGYRVGFVLLAHAVRQAGQDGMTEYRLLRGGEDYKYRFATVDPGLQTIGMPRGPVASAALPLLAELRVRQGPLAHASRRMIGGFVNPDLAAHRAGA